MKFTAGDVYVGTGKDKEKIDLEPELLEIVTVMLLEINQMTSRTVIKNQNLLQKHFSQPIDAVSFLTGSLANAVASAVADDTVLAAKSCCDGDMGKFATLSANALVEARNIFLQSFADSFDANRTSIFKSHVDSLNEEFNASKDH